MIASNVVSALGLGAQDSLTLDILTPAFNFEPEVTCG